MARISKGILGGFSGTVGNVVGGSWKGISYMRSQSTAKRNSFTPAQLQQQARFTLAIKFLQPMNALLEISFRKQAVHMTGINSALSFTLKNAVTGVYPAYTISYSLALVSRGDLPNAGAPTASATVAGQVGFAWTDNSGNGKAAASDKAILVVYCPALNQCIFTTAGPLRSAANAVLAVPAFSGQQVQTYIGFISADGRDIASSMFTGQLTVL
jgi:uncharacterized protein DUF6266